MEETSRPSSSVSGTWRRQETGGQERGARQTEEDIRVRQKQQLTQFYQNIDQQKETQLRVDLESRKHHDNLLPNQKSPVHLNRFAAQYLWNNDSNHANCNRRYEEQDANGHQALYLNAGKKPDDCKMVAKAIFSFQVSSKYGCCQGCGSFIYY